MDFKAEQDRLDKIKWDDSMREGRDKCGTYDFCACCKKEAQYPCARAAIAIVTATSALRFCAPVNKFFTAQTGRKSDKQRLFSSERDSTAFFKKEKAFFILRKR